MSGGKRIKDDMWEVRRNQCGDRRSSQEGREEEDHGGKMVQRWLQVEGLLKKMQFMRSEKWDYKMEDEEERLKMWEEKMMRYCSLT